MDGSQGKRKVLVGGCFDVIHFGHVLFLKKAKEQGDFLTVALESDQYIRKNKKREPVHNQKQRAMILSSIKYIDQVVELPLLSSDQEYFDLVEKIQPHVIAVTKGDPQLKNKKKQAAKIGAKLIEVTKIVGNFSTKNILQNKA